MAPQSRRPWADDEVSKLCEYVGKNGPKNWKAVAVYIGTGRTHNGCRQRWFEFHRPGVKTGEFTPVEKLNVLLLHSKLKKNRWSKIAKRLPGRTSNQVKNYYNKIIKKKASDFPKAVLKTLVETVEAQGKDIQSCLHPSAYKEFVRVYAEPPPATAAAQLQPQQNDITNFASPPEIPHAPPQQNEHWLATEAAATVAPSSSGIADYGEGFDLAGDVLFSGIPDFAGPPEIPHAPPQQNEFDEFNLDHLDLSVEIGDQNIEFLPWAST